MPTERKCRLLVVDDEVELRHALCESLAGEEFETEGAASADEGLSLLAEHEFDLVLSDLMMPGIDGIQMLRKAIQADPSLVGIIMTGQGTIASAIDAMKVGAFDYVLKPFNLQTMLPILRRAWEVRRLRIENRRLRKYVDRLTFESPRYELIGRSPPMQRVFQLIEKVAPTDATVLIRGPSGTGKELVARALHRNSPRSERPMVTINCAALQESLLESELFGHEKGSFTGAQQAKPGLVEVAEGGTLFIDEVAEMAPSAQAKLLRVLEDGQYRRIGSTKDARSNLRVIAATNKPLEAEQQAGRFREDLYFRLNVVTIDLPPLRERREDIPLLVNHFLTTRQVGKRTFEPEPSVMEAFLAYQWPGNVRELANVLERAQILAEGDQLTLDDLPEMIRAYPQAKPTETTSETPFNLNDLERRTVVAALENAQGNKLRTASLLGISRRSLYRLIEKYHLDAPGSSEVEPIELA